VGATSALLAANASGRWDCESSLSSRQSSSGTCDSLLEVRLDEPKATELNRLVEKGDWEGVIPAASTFESDGKFLEDLCYLTRICEALLHLAQRRHILRINPCLLKGWPSDQRQARVQELPRITTEEQSATSAFFGSSSPRGAGMNPFLQDLDTRVVWEQQQRTPYDSVG
jgi:hypothetical protein